VVTLPVCGGCVPDEQISSLMHLWNGERDSAAVDGQYNVVGNLRRCPIVYETPLSLPSWL
jgi:hypothetical protein